jgi:hypothetical protein
MKKQSEINSLQKNKNLIMMKYSIIDKYLRYNYLLKPITQRHFLFRLYISSYKNKDKVISILNDKSYSFTKEQIYKFEEQIINNYEQFKVDFTNSIRKHKNIKITDKNKYYILTKNIDLTILHSLLEIMFYTQFFNIKLSNLLIDKFIINIKSKILENLEFVRYAPSASSDIVYYLYNLNIVDLRVDYIKLFLKVFKGANHNDNESIMNYLYGLTHIIIGASNYYRKQIHGLEWINKIFSKYNNIIIKSTLDLHLEVAICQKLLGIENSNIIDNSLSRSFKQFNPKKEYIIRENYNTFNLAEHQNILFILLTDYLGINN